MRLTTLPVTRAPRGNLLFHHGSRGRRSSCFRPREMRSFSRSKLRTLTVDGVPDLEEVGGVAHPAVGQVGDVQQAVQAAQVHEDAVVGDILDHALHDLALFQGGQQGGLGFALDLLQQAPGGRGPRCAACG